jgi:tetrahydromethanopterin S-methyltransferase subunit A
MSNDSRAIKPVRGGVPERMASDPAGYFLIFSDSARGLLTVEHYTNDGVLTTIIAGGTAAEVYMTAIEHKLVTRLDHAAYLGRELARAERALTSGEIYVQDAAPEDR